MQHSDAQLYNTQKFISSLILPMTGNIGLNRRHHYNDQPYIYKFYFKDIAHDVKNLSHIKKTTKHELTKNNILKLLNNYLPMTSY